MEKQFDKYFFAGVHEMKLMDLIVCDKEMMSWFLTSSRDSKTSEAIVVACL